MIRARTAILEWVSQFIDYDQNEDLGSIEQKLVIRLRDRFNDGHLILDLEQLEEIIQKTVKDAASLGFNNGLDLGQRL